ncbi:tyrosine phosphatase family protein [bacterium BMS3Abin04]|nr:tyrosine phosphatase family protein [bacterium BMS3Abin04]
MLLISGCVNKSQKQKYIPPATSVVDKQFNFHIVDSALWRSAQPNSESLKRMKHFGLKTVINLRGDSVTNEWERELADSLNLNYYNFPLDSHKEQNSDEINLILKIINQKKNQPVLTHCLGGKDRTGLITALYELKRGNKTLSEIHKEMLMYGYDEDKFPKIYEFVKKWTNGLIK